MPQTTKPLKGSKPEAKKPKSKPKARSLDFIPKVVEEATASSEDSEDDDEGIDEEGIMRLMKALGEDGLDEYDQAQLQILGGDNDSSGDGEGDEDEDAAEGEDNSDLGGIDSGSDNSDGEGEDDEDQDDEDVEEDAEENDEEDVEADAEEDILLEDVESVDDDAVPRQKVEIDNKVAMERIRETIQLDPTFPWTETLTLTYPDTIDVDVNDDLNREVAFYKQALHSANEARALAAKHKFPFTRPTDYFAEMVKNDAHMERIRQRLLDESAGIKKSEDKRKEREGKKFGKQVQVEKLKEREKSKKEMEERLKGLKRKRGDVLDNAQTTGGDDDFDIAVEDAISDRPAKRGKMSGGKGLARPARDQKYGFGGAGRRSKQNTQESTDDFSSGTGRGRGGFGGRGGRGGGERGGRGGERGGRGGERGGRGGERGGRGGERGGRGGGRGGRGGGRGGRGGRSDGGGRGGAGGKAGGAKRLGKSRRMNARS